MFLFVCFVVFFFFFCFFFFFFFFVVVVFFFFFFFCLFFVSFVFFFCVCVCFFFFLFFFFFFFLSVLPSCPIIYIFCFPLIWRLLTMTQIRLSIFCVFMLFLHVFVMKEGCDLQLCHALERSCFILLLKIR